MNSVEKFIGESQLKSTPTKKFTFIIDDKKVTTAKIANNAITEEKISGEDTPEGAAVTTSKIKDGAVTNPKIANGAVTTIKIQDFDAESSFPTGITNEKLADESVTESKLASGAVTDGKIAPNAVTAGKIADDAVIAGNIAAGAISHENLGAGCVQAGNIANGAVEHENLAPNAVQEGNIAAGAIHTEDIHDGAVTTAKIEDYDSNSATPTGITTAKIADYNVTEAKLAPQAVTTDKLAPGLISEIENITDAVPTAGSVKPVQSGGVEAAIRPIRNNVIGATETYTFNMTSTQYIDTEFRLQDYEDVSLYTDADDIAQSGMKMYFYIYTSVSDRVSKQIVNKTLYPSLRKLFDNYNGVIYGYAYYVTGADLPGDVIATFEYVSLKDDVATLKTKVSSLESSTSEMSSDIEHINGDISNINTDIDGLKSGKEDTCKNQASKDLSVSGATQNIFYVEKNWGKKVAVRIVENTAVLSSGASITCQARREGGSITKALSENYSSFESATDINRIYIYASGNTIATAGSITVEIVFGDGFYTAVIDATPTKDSEHFVTSGGVYQAIGAEAKNREDEIYSVSSIIKSGTLSKEDTPYDVLQGFFSYETGEYQSNSGITTRLFDISHNELSIMAESGFNDNSAAIIAFFSDKNHTEQSYIKEYSLQSIGIPNGSTQGTVYHVNSMSIPQNAVLVAISNRLASLAEDYHKEEIEVYDKPVYESDIEKSVHNVGNSSYYGRLQTLEITDEVHKLTSVEKVAHIYSDYSNTVKNQSLAIWDNKYFCFNDGAVNGFCVIIDMETNNVLDVADTPTGFESGHNNNANFTDIYYDSDDKYPLILLSRGDYASNDAISKSMHVLRVKEENSQFTFEVVKTIYYDNSPYTTFNASWTYDKQRKIIWGYLSVYGDWRLGLPNYMKFNGESRAFCADNDTTHICVTSAGALALEASDITIHLSGASAVTRTVHVEAGDEIDEVFEYDPSIGGFMRITLAQSQNTNAFPGVYKLYMCDSNGENRREIIRRSCILGFDSPDLTDGNNTTIASEAMSNPVFIDTCILQGGDCFNGKLYLSVGSYSTVNNCPVTFRSNCCFILDPISGYIESIVPIDRLEPEGCAIYNGKLYVSSHNGGATEQTTTPCFKITEYSFI